MVIYHNPKCSKSRDTLALLRQKGIEPEIVEYMHNPPTKEELRDIVRKLEAEPQEIVRTDESVWKEKYAAHDLSGEEFLDAIVSDPILLQRPIVIDGERAVIGRPPENVLMLFSE